MKADLYTILMNGFLKKGFRLVERKTLIDHGITHISEKYRRPILLSPKWALNFAYQLKEFNGDIANEQIFIDIGGWGDYECKTIMITTHIVSMEM